MVTPQEFVLPYEKNKGSWKLSYYLSTFFVMSMSVFLEKPNIYI